MSRLLAESGAYLLAEDGGYLLLEDGDTDLSPNVIELTASIRTGLDLLTAVRPALSLVASVRRTVDTTRRRSRKMTYDLRVGDTGTKILLQIVDENSDSVDVSDAEISITLKESKGAPKVFDPGDIEFDTDGTDGRVFVLTLADTLDTSGTWYAQAVATIGDAVFHSRPVPFTVGANL